MRVLPPPSSVTLFPPSITVSALMAFSDVTVMVTGAAPQSNVITPPFASAASRAASVQLPGVPSPTTAFGADVSAAWMGSGHVGGGGLGAPPSPPVPLVLVPVLLVPVLLVLLVPPAPPVGPPLFPLPPPHDSAA